MEANRIIHEKDAKGTRDTAAAMVTETGSASSTMLDEEGPRPDASENEDVVVELYKEQRMPGEHQEVYSVFGKARQDLNAARRSRGLFPVEAMDTA